MTLNLTTQYYSTSRDFAVIENDPNDIAAIEAVFNADFQNKSVTPGDGDDLVWSPTNSESSLLAIINGATKSLLIENEEMSDTDIVNAIVSAAERGVDVQVTMTANSDYTSELNKIVAAGGQVATYAETASLYIHAKVILADYGTSAANVFIGSENFSNAPLTENRELGLTITVAAIMSSINTTLTRDFNGGVPYGNSSGFSISAKPSPITVAAGSSGASTVTSTITGSFKSAVSLAASGMPTGVTAKFSPASIASPGSGNSTLTLTTTSSVAAGSYPITITATGGGDTRTATVTLNATSGATPSFTISANPSTLTIKQGSSGTSAITTSVSGGFSNSIALSASGLPTGVTASFSPSTIASPGSGTSTLTLTVPSSTTAGPYSITIQGTGGGLTESTAPALTVSSSGGGTTQLITDGGFESATKSGNSAPGWTATSNVSGHNVIIYNGSYPHSGKSYARFGSSNNETDTLIQTLTVPSGATSAPVTFYVNITTNETSSSSYDYLHFEIHSTSGTLLATPLTLSNVNATSDSNKSGVYFQPASIDLSSYAGQTIELEFHATTDYEYTTTFLVDDVSVLAN